LGSKAEFEANFLGDSRYNKSEHFYLFFKPKDYVLVAQYTAAVRFERTILTLEFMKIVIEASKLTFE